MKIEEFILLQLGEPIEKIKEHFISGKDLVRLMEIWGEMQYNKAIADFIQKN